MPTFSSQLGSQKAQQGLLQLGAAGDAPYTPPGMPTSARPWMAHLYNNDWSFRASLGALIGTRPILKQSVNAGFQPVTIELPTLNATIQPGNLIVITEEGGDATGSAPAGIPVIGGTVEQVPDTLDVAGWKHEITITPFIAELGDAYLNKNYSTATDVAQMVRDAIATTNHLRCTPYSVPNTGVTAIYNFTYAPALEVVNLARLMAGVNYSWHVDAIGMVWFQAINTNASAMFTVTQKDYTSRTSNGGDISGLKNFVLVTGAINAAGPMSATYTNPTSQTKYGLRAMNPPINLPSCNDQPTLNAVAATVGGVFDRVINRVTIKLPAYSQRILLGQPGGATMRYWEPVKTPLAESESGSGTYSANYVVLDVETDGIQQTVTLGDVPVTSIHDLQYQIDRIAARTALTNLHQPPFVTAGTNVISGGGAITSANGAALADGIGLISSRILGLGAASGGFGPLTSTATSWTTIPGATTAFAGLARNQFLLITATLYGTTAGASGQRSLISLGIDDTTIGSSTVVFDKATTAWTNGALVEIQTGMPGLHVISLMAQVDAGQTVTIQWGQIYVFKFGS